MMCGKAVFLPHSGKWQRQPMVGLSIDLKNIPIKQHTIEVCEYFNLNPYMLRSGGTLLLACANWSQNCRAVEKCWSAGGSDWTDDRRNDRLIRYDEEARFLEPPKMDEYYKVN